MFAKPRHTRSSISGTLAFLEEVYFGTVQHAQIQWPERCARIDWVDGSDGCVCYGLLFYVSADGGQNVANQGRLYALFYLRHRHVHDT